MEIVVASVQAKGKLRKVPANAQSTIPILKGDHVCISHKAQTFQWGHDEKWTREIFEVYQPLRQLGVCKYHLQDLQGEDLKGTFYEAELQKVTYSPDQTFEVEWELNHRGHGRKQEVLVKWKGWPDKFNSWVAADTIDNQPT